MINATTPSARTDLKSPAFVLGTLLVNIMLWFFINYFLLVVAFPDFSSLRSHFWPFSQVLGGIWRFVTRKKQKL
jgi:hypothetical protein